MTVNNKFPLASLVTLKTAPKEAVYFVRQITICCDGSFGYTLTSGTNTFFAIEEECEAFKPVSDIGFTING